MKSLIPVVTRITWDVQVRNGPDDVRCFIMSPLYAGASIRGQVEWMAVL